MKITRSDVKQILENPEIKTACEKVANLEYGFPSIYSMTGILCYALGLEESDVPDSFSAMHYHDQILYSDPHFVDIQEAMNELRQLIKKMDLYPILVK